MRWDAMREVTTEECGPLHSQLAQQPPNEPTRLMLWYVRLSDPHDHRSLVTKQPHLAEFLG